jgi:uncharacterized protein YaaQ
MPFHAVLHEGNPFALHGLQDDHLQLFRGLVERGANGIEIVATAGVIKGKTVTTVRKCRFDAEVCGATFVDREVVVSGNLVTARTWHDNPAFMREFIKLLKGNL